MLSVSNCHGPSNQLPDCSNVRKMNQIASLGFWNRKRRGKGSDSGAVLDWKFLCVVCFCGCHLCSHILFFFFSFGRSCFIEL